MGSLKRNSVLSPNTLTSQSVPSERFFSALVKTAAAGKKREGQDGGRGWREGWWDLRWTLEAELALILSWPYFCPQFHPPPLLSPFSLPVRLSNRRCPDPKHSSLWLWDRAGQSGVGRRKTLRRRQIPLLSSVTSCHFLSFFVHNSKCDGWWQNILVVMSISLLLTDDLFRVLDFFKLGDTNEQCNNHQFISSHDDTNKKEIQLTGKLVSH